MKPFLKLLLLSCVFSVLLSLLFTSIEDLHCFVYGLNIASIYAIVNGLGKRIVFPEFITFSAITLWLTVPLLIYDLHLEHFAIPNLFGSEILAIKKTEYYKWALPATLAMTLGLNLNSFKVSRIKTQFLDLEPYLSQVNRELPKILFGIGALALLIGKYLPGSLGFVFFLLSQLTFIAVLYCIYGNFSYSKWIYWGAALISLQGVASGGMFGELVWWGLIIAIYALIKFQWSFVKKFALITLGVFLINTLQVVKGEYRRLTWYKNSGEKAGLALLGKTVWKATFNHQGSSSNAGAFFLMYRMNHAYTVSRVMKHVPKKEPYAQGETVVGSLFASFVPRFLWPTKPKSGGHDNMERFANFNPHGGASYDIGQIGDAWANYGYAGGITFLFLYGFLNSWILKVLLNISRSRAPTLILWAPIIFLQLLKVEVSVVTNFNATIKGAIFIAIVYWICKAFGAKI